MFLQSNDSKYNNNKLNNMYNILSRGTARLIPTIQSFSFSSYFQYFFFYCFISEYERVWKNPIQWPLAKVDNTTQEKADIGDYLVWFWWCYMGNCRLWRILFMHTKVQQLSSDQLSHIIILTFQQTSHCFKPHKQNKKGPVEVRIYSCFLPKRKDTLY